ncbi:MAG TPA: cation:dicarboxylase symporter family transporter [Flavobacterium sp.]|nr:cation:dicarboxylase symporter family transporter [Flavobacterium sp.]
MSVLPSTSSWSFRLFTNLTTWVLLAIIAGIALGHWSPQTGQEMKVLGDWFVAGIKCFIGPIIFLTIVLGIAGMGDLRKVGRIGLKALVYFEIVSTLALVIGVGAAYLIEPGRIDRRQLALPETKVPGNGNGHFDWMQFFLDNLTLQVLLAAIVCGIALNYSSHRQRVVDGLYEISSFVFKLLKWLMYLAPVGAFGGMAYTIGKFGLATLLPLGKLMLTMYVTMAIFVFGILGGILRYYGLSLRKFLRHIQAELLVVLGTSSSESALPRLMEKLQEMGCSRAVVGLVVPTGYSFNLDGTSIYLSMAVIFLAQLYNVPLTITDIMTILFLLMLTSKGAAGVTGSGFIVLASTLTALQKIPVEGLAFLLGVDKFMSEARAITNCIGNGVAAIVISKQEGDFQADPERALD